MEIKLPLYLVERTTGDNCMKAEIRHQMPIIVINSQHVLGHSSQCNETGNGIHEIHKEDKNHLT